MLAALFRGKLLALLRAAHHEGGLRLPDEKGLPDPDRFERLCSALYKRPWVVYAKRPFGRAEHVVRYLGRYTHRVGLSNRRLVSLDERGVTFRTKNGKTVTVAPVEFLSRFVEHVLPRRFVKIRHYGLFAPANVSTLLAAARADRTRSTQPPAWRTRAPGRGGVTARRPSLACVRCAPSRPMCLRP